MNIISLKQLSLFFNTGFLSLAHFPTCCSHHQQLYCLEACQHYYITGFSFLLFKKSVLQAFQSFSLLIFLLNRRKCGFLLDHYSFYVGSIILYKQGQLWARYIQVCSCVSGHQFKSVFQITILCVMFVWIQSENRLVDSVFSKVWYRDRTLIHSVMLENPSVRASCSEGVQSIFIWTILNLHLFILLYYRAQEEYHGVLFLFIIFIIILPVNTLNVCFQDTLSCWPLILFLITKQRWSHVLWRSGFWNSKSGSISFMIKSWIFCSVPSFLFFPILCPPGFCFLYHTALLWEKYSYKPEGLEKKVDQRASVVIRSVYLGFPGWQSQSFHVQFAEIKIYKLVRFGDI